MGSLLIEIVVDCRDPATLARWWGEVLGWPVVDDPRGITWISASGGFDQLPLITFLPVPEDKTIKNRLHLDVSPTGCDQAEELERLLGLGATHVDVGQPADAPFIVLADPEGNEFCLLGRRVDR
jgi:catechol 2,3-dioxygenase-like lactoylglutathione lyase family enzyme